MRSRLRYFVQPLHTAELKEHKTERAEAYKKAQQLREKLQCQMNQLLSIKVTSEKF